MERDLLKRQEIEGVPLPVSRLFFGTAMSPMLEGKVVDDLLDEVFALGVNAFDTARGYQGAEKSLGHWLRQRGNRDQVVILSKCGNVNAFGHVKVNRQVIEKELSESLKALGTDYIDIYLLHRDDPKTPVSEVIETLNKAKEEGKVKVFGVSNWTHERIMEANAYAKEHGLSGFSVSSPNFGLARQMKDPWGGACVTISGPEGTDARQWYKKTQMPVVAYSSLGRGFFSGRFAAFDTAGAKKVLDAPGQKGYLYPENMERLSRAEELAKRDGCTVSEVAFRYIFSSGMNLFAV
ncbi:MAG: aldo/keto reductase, partial [Blautia sp.]|nr:aldo/keto reductase [Blautia sp.]